MSLNPPSGNMYSWAHTVNYWGGICGLCDYCFVPNKFKWHSKYQGPMYFAYRGKNLPKLPILPKDSGMLIFVQPMGEIYNFKVHYADRERVLWHLHHFDNPYLIVSKYPGFMDVDLDRFPKRTILGTTLETNGSTKKWSRAPSTEQRAKDFAALDYAHKMVSIEPIMYFDPEKLYKMIEKIAPIFVAIGANSYRQIRLPEPNKKELEVLINMLSGLCEVRLKKNLRCLGLDMIEDWTIPLGASFHA